VERAKAEFVMQDERSFMDLFACAAAKATVAFARESLRILNLAVEKYRAARFIVEAIEESVLRLEMSYSIDRFRSPR
jgi:hypothetical protein